jgi:hypothetical protein
MGLLACVLRPSGPTNGRPPCSFRLSLGDMVPMVPDLINRARQYAELYIAHIVCYHGILKTIISDRGSIFVEYFWEQLHECPGTHLI